MREGRALGARRFGWRDGGVAAGATSEVALYQESRILFYVSCYAHALLAGLTAMALS